MNGTVHAFFISLIFHSAKHNMIVADLEVYTYF